MLRILILFFFFFSFPLGAATTKVIVSVAPSKYLVEKIAGNWVECVLFVPPATSPHSYEPTLRQIVEHENASLWFRIGENFENKILRVLEGKMKIVDLRDRLPLMSSKCSCHHLDTHIWLSPKLLKIQSQTIFEALQELLPEQKDLFEKNFRELIQDIDLLDQEIRQLLKDKQGKAFLVSHPAFGYFSRDYGVVELSIEIEGKEPTPRQITLLLNEAKEKNVHIIITQPQYSNRGALILSHELNAEMKSIDPYKENVLDNLRTLAHILADG